MPFEVTYQGSVNRWECDENDHLNVRFYLQKVHQGLIIAAQKFRLLDHTSSGSFLDALRCHHIRYLREARIAVPLIADCGIVSWDAPHLQLLSQLRHTLTGELMATFVSDFELSAEQSAQTQQAAPFRYVEVSEQAAPRGVPAQVSEYASLSASAALAHGYRQVGAGVITAGECDEQGRILHWHYMGRTSDGMPNFWSATQSIEELDARSEGYVGGAVLEYRMQFHRRLSRGDAYVHLAAVGEIGNKTQGISHLLYHVASGQLAMSAEAMGISLDLQTRKSVAIPADRRARMQAMQRRPLET